MKIAKGLVILITGTVVLSGCSVTRMRVDRLKPAEVNLSGYKTIGVGDVSGPGGRAICDGLTQALFQSNRFTVIERGAMARVLAEQNLGEDGLVDPNSAASVGKLVGCQTIIVGSVTRRDYREKYARDDLTCSGNNGSYPCYDFSTTGNWTLNVVLKVVDTTSGQLVAVKALSVTEEKQVRTAQTQPEPYPEIHPPITWDIESIFDELAQRVVSDFMTVIAPYHVQVDVQLFTDSDLPELESGVNLAKAGDWAGAITHFKAACARADSSTDVSAQVKGRCHYNLGVAYGYSGQSYDEAERELSAAIALRAESVFSTELTKIRGFRADEVKLRSQNAM